MASQQGLPLLAQVLLLVPPLSLLLLGASHKPELGPSSALGANPDPELNSRSCIVGMPQGNAGRRRWVITRLHGVLVRLLGMSSKLLHCGFD